jgi:N-acetylmuramic acid 6-phosphate etherase
MDETEERPTEARNPRAAGLADLSTRELLELINEEDTTVPPAVGRAIASIERAVDVIVDALERGGRLRYAGAGTSGRLGVLDASEAPPTFGVGTDLVKGIIAGGDRALRSAIEGAEDDTSPATLAGVAADIRGGDAVVGISAGGRAAFVLEALRIAREKGARTIALTCDPASPLAAFADVTIAVEVGPELVAGSSRLKAGTATKLVLNMLSTAAMVRLGRTKGDLMVDLRATNRKLRERAVRIVMQEAGVGADEARARLEAASWDVRRALEGTAGGR